MTIFFQHPQRKIVFKKMNFERFKFSNFHQNSSKIVIATAVCGVRRVEEALIMIRSALVFSTKIERLKFIILSEKSFAKMIENNLKILQNSYEFSFEMKELIKPPESWKSIFKPCDCQRLVIQDSLKEIDSLLFVDAAVIFLSSPKEIFKLFKSFNSTQIAGLVHEHEIADSWYPKVKAVPFYGEFGVNSGVFLMNLTRMREVKMEDKVPELHEKYKQKIM
jgi:UDP-xylose:glucoside alpha-1,3-xylosyltransferase